MALTKITANIIEDGAISTSSLADTSITADKLHTTLDLTGKSVTVATATAGDNDTTVASTAFVSTAIANLADSAPETLNTLNELAAALGDDANFSTTVTNSIALKAPLASPTFTGTLTASGLAYPTSDGTNGQALVTNGSGTLSFSTIQGYTDSDVETYLNTSEIYTDPTNNRLGIGTSSPLSTMHLSTTGGGSVYLQDSDATSTYNISEISNNAGNFGIQTRNSSGTFVSTDYQIVKNASGADYHRWFTQGSERMRINSSGNVGIGTTNPTEDLTIASTSPQIRFEDTDASGTPYSKVSGVLGNIYIQADDGNEIADSKIDFRVDGTQRMVIDSSGNVLVGKTAVGVGTAGIELRANNMAAISRSGDNVLYLNRITDTGSILEFRKDNVAVGNIGVVSTDRMYFATADGLGLQLDKDNNRIIPCDAAGAYNNNVELGDSSLEFTNLWLSNNAYIGNSVGIGTTSPATTLHVTGTVGAFSSNNDNRILMYNNGTVASINVTYGTVGPYLPLTFLTGDAERMRIASDGKVGIGTSIAPHQKLTVTGPSGAADGVLSNGILALTTGTGALADTKLLFGIVDDDYAWIQPADYGVAYRDLALNPNGGNVGIGTTSPSTELHVYSADQNALKIQTNTGINQIELANSTNSPTYLTQNSYGFELKVDENGWGGSNSFFAVKVKAAERMRINSAGQTLINTTDGNMPTAGGNADCVIYGGAGNGFAYNALHVGGGRISLNAQPNSNSTRGYIECSGGGFKIWHVDNSDMIFGVNDSEKMRIQYSDGRIRSQPTYDNTAPATHRDVYVENSGQLGYASSVRAHKTNINSYGDASWLYQIDPKTFNYRKPNTTPVTNEDGFTEEVRDGTYSDTEYYDTVEVGFIAEDVEEHDQNLCFYNEVEDEDGNVTNELAGIHYKSMVVPMLKLIKEQKTLIDNLTSRIETLENP
jgi:hypothetical protein